VPVAEIAGNAKNKASLLVVTRKVTVCPLSFPGPGEMLVAQPLTVCAPASSFTV
jgi:hypothetical protein